MAEVCASIIPWKIWEERNARVLQGKQREWQVIAILAINKSVEWLSSMKEFADMNGEVLRRSWNLIANQNTHHRIKQPTQWSTPTQGCIKLNTDSSSLGNTGPAGFGGLFRDDNGNTIIVLWTTGD
ncbi:hypothetical protein H6P81_019922 [Aristolochia fimbriata]|uniref:RNase H type-1 domain-containing protein n=1 Tax=Aristolochia fimbriata TaxID=158543 RepID=A0AAV7DWA5_ARIFI|nr:hypothetical protein H6P81_019922 [Aristolochia fimbriata]